VEEVGLPGHPVLRDAAQEVNTAATITIIAARAKYLVFMFSSFKNNEINQLLFYKHIF
jgi:hypothetical protein